MDWNKGFSSQYYATIVDPVTWKDGERMEITGGSIKTMDSGLYNSAEIHCTGYNSKEAWIRVWLDAEQAGDSTHTPLFTGLVSSPEVDIEGNLMSSSLTCYSVLKPAQDVLLPLGYYASAGINGAQLVKNLLKDVVPAPIEIIGNAPALAQHIIAEDNENHSSMVSKILSAIGWRIRIKGDGTIQICGKAKEANSSFDPLGNDSIEPKLRAVNDWYSCPNVFRAVMGDTSAIARDDSSRALSIAVRGREIWAEEKDCHLNVNETLAEYARRRLIEEQRHYLSVSYDRRFRPDVIASDLVRLHYPEQKVDGLFYVVSQSIELNYGARTSEEVVQV